MTTERTLAIIKPDAVASGAAGRIIAKIEQGGFKILAAKLIRMSFEPVHVHDAGALHPHGPGIG